MRYGRQRASVYLDARMVTSIAIPPPPRSLYYLHGPPHESFDGWGEIRRIRPRGGHQNSSFRGQDYMIPYTVGILASNSTHFTKDLAKYVPGRGYFRAVSSKNGDKFVTSPSGECLSST